MKPLKEGLVTFYFQLKKDGTAKIDYLGMSKRYQGQGRGTQIVLEFIEFCKSKGINKILIDAHMDAVIFWKKMGFKIDRKPAKTIKSVFSGIAFSKFSEKSFPLLIN